MPDWKPYRIKLSRCPHCGHKLDACSSFGEERAPRPGDLSVCLGCCQVVQFGPRLALQRVRASVIAALLPDEREELEAVRAHVREYREAEDLVSGAIARQFRKARN